MCKAGITTVSLERQGDHLHVEVGIFFTYNQVGDNDSQLFIPMLSSDNHQIELPALLIAGKRHYWSLRLALWGLDRNVLSHYRIRKVLKAVNRTSANYMYRVKLDYEDWMEKAKISLAH